MTAPGRLLVFARNPVAGRVKTRLVPVLGAEAATALYREMLRRTLETVAQLGGVRAELWLDGAATDRELQHLVRYHGLTLKLQQGPDLGARMAKALAEATGSGCRAVLIGSDCPEYDAAYLEAAFSALADHDVVIGPAADGGYVLIGATRPQPALFQDIAWGTAGVLEATRQRLRRLGLRWHDLPTLHDLDEPADLARFPTLAALAGAAAQPTR